MLPQAPVRDERMAERAERRNRRSVLYVPGTDDLYLIGLDRAMALHLGELALPDLIGQRIFVGHIAWTLMDGDMVEIRPMPGSRYLIGPDGCIDEAESTADADAFFMTMGAAHADPRKKSAAFRMQHRRVELSRWLLSRETTPELFARFADYFVLGIRRPKFHPTMRGLRVEMVKRTDGDADE